MVAYKTRVTGQWVFIVEHTLFTFSPNYACLNKIYEYVIQAQNVSEMLHCITCAYQSRILIFEYSFHVYFSLTHVF